MLYDYANENDHTAARALNDEDAAFDAAQARIDAIMSYLGDVPHAGHFADCDR